MPVGLNAVRYLAAGDETDAALLGRFADRRDEAAFAVLVRRHGAMVFGVCRRLLATDQDAEDAFQATFLVLARKAGTAAPRDVGNWLYGVARRAALLARRTIARRRERTGKVPDRPASEADRLRAMLDEELGRLPDHYRAVVVLCDLEGRTRREAAAQLGWPEGTVAGRLARARELLAKRLAPAVSLAALLAGSSAARVPAVLTPTGPIPFGIAALARDTLVTTTRGKMMKAAAAVLLLGCAGFGVVLHAGRETPGAPANPAPAAGGVQPAEKLGAAVRPDPDAAFAWGEAVGGLQAGIAFGDAKAFRIGEKVTPKVRIRNVGQAPVAYSYFYARFRFATPRVADPLGRRVPVTDPPHFFSFPASKDDTLKAGDSIDFGGATLELAPTEEHYHHAIRVEPGKYTLGFDGFVKSHPKLGTGIAEFEVKPAAAPPAFDVAAATAPAAPAGVRPGVSVHLSKSPPWPGHSRCAFLDDDRILVHAGPGSGDANTVHRGLQVRSAKDGTLLKSVTLPGHLVGEFRVSADRKWVAAATTADTTGTFVIPAPGVTVWDAATWTVRGTVAGHALLALASDGRTVLVREDDGWGAQGGRVEVWDAVAGKRLRAAPFDFQGIDAGALSPDGSLAVVSGFNEVAYWKWRDGDAHDRVRVGRRVSDLAFSPDGKHVAEGPGPRQTVEVRDAATLKVARTLSDPAQPRVSLLTAGLTFADGGKALVLGNGIGLIPSIPVPHRIHVWDVRTGALLRQIDTEGGAPYSLDVSPDGNTLAATTADDGVSLRTWGLGKADGPAPR